MSDQSAYLKAQMIFWLLGATDGHAKNFSVFLTPGQRYRLTPLYDVLTAQPSVDAGQVNVKKFKLAMSVGDKNHYRIGDIQPRYFLQTADRCKFDREAVTADLDALLGEAEGVTEKVLNVHKKLLPSVLAASILSGVKARVRTLALWKEHDRKQSAAA